MEKFFNKYTFLVMAIAFGLMMAGSASTKNSTSPTSKKVYDRPI